MPSHSTYAAIDVLEMTLVGVRVTEFGFMLAAMGRARWAWLRGLGVVSLLTSSAGLAFAQQVVDPNFAPKVSRPAHKADGPKVLFDEAHQNFHTASGRYKGFVDLISADGYQVTSNRAPFTRQSLNGYAVLAIANARGATTPADSAFTEPEIAAVIEWVRAGGALLLIADHAPYGAAAAALARRLGVDMSQGWTTDPANHDQQSGNQGFIIFTRASSRLADHAITRGRDASERLNIVMSFTGQSLKGPEGSVSLLRLADTAVDALPDASPDARTSAAGRSQAVVFPLGRGRVAVLGEAGMMSAQLIGPEQRPMGMNHPGIDNQQWVLNLMHWLTGLLK